MVEIRFADQDRAGVDEALHGGGGTLGGIRERRARCRGRMACDIDIVFDSERDAIQRQCAVGGVRFQALRLRQHRLSGEPIYPRVMAIAFGSCGEHFVGELRRRQLSLA